MANNNKVTFNYYRNLINRYRKSCRAKYYENKVKDLNECNPRNWWSYVKSLSGMATPRSDILDILKIPEIDKHSTSPYEIANVINYQLLQPMQMYSTLISDDSANLVRDESSFLTVTEISVANALKSLNPHKAAGPDGISNWLLREYAEVLAFPITSILNSSYLEQRLPDIWKKADVAPIPKSKPIKDVCKHIRPISLTPIMSKLAEEFVVQQFVQPAILSVLDKNQFGAIPGSSTTNALISMIDCWSKATDGNGATVRIVLFDFKKAFDLIDHNLLMSKLRQLELDSRVINWLKDFLTNRYQRTKLASDCYSEWGRVPQGSKRSSTRH